MIVRTSDLTIHPCGFPRALGCAHPECRDPEADFGAQGEVTNIGFDSKGRCWLELDWGYTIIVLPTTTIEILPGLG